MPSMPPLLSRPIRSIQLLPSFRGPSYIDQGVWNPDTGLDCPAWPKNVGAFDSVIVIQKTPQDYSTDNFRGVSSPRRGRAANPEDIPTSFHTLLGTTLFFFGNSIAANPELALPGEPPIPVPYWIAALDVFESGEHLPSRIDSFVNATTYKSDNLSRDHTPPPREDWRMGVMWGRTLVALATEMADRHRNDPPPPEPEHFPSPFPTNTDYLKTGTIWDDEPEWPAESLFGLIAARRAPWTISPEASSTCHAIPPTALHFLDKQSPHSFLGLSRSTRSPTKCCFLLKSYQILKSGRSGPYMPNPSSIRSTPPRHANTRVKALQLPPRPPPQKI